ncbi:outer membrane protein assembly factor BamE [Methylomicrobium sp. Wu6]|uniref:outer membrane protein assembly factor BamE n=1 Tax=Methylomicrobium sp. Wu6 TaxID=3107928 RepID=UPI002DD643D0|nr:outer membrane protein assembly factor BamE [Methylomicrobium sp. Wu6]MEC4748370.1 outer membrane protein assembly factor BamE [Methylomicrobium sp. Wu6]
MRKPLFYSALLASLSVAACSMILNNLPGVYTVDVQQGNIVDQSMIDQLRPGMSKRQVLYIMGSPMLKDVFHENHWEYLYSNQPGGEARQQKRISLYFEGDKIVGLQGDFKPSKLPVLKPSPDATVDVPKRNLDESLWGSLTQWFSSGDSGAVEKPKQEEVKGKTAELKSAQKKESKGLWETLTGWMSSDETVAPEKTKGQGAPADSESPEQNIGDNPQKEDSVKPEEPKP